MDRDSLIRERAYFLWEKEGRPSDRASAHWAMAELALNDLDRKPEPAAKRPSKRSVKPQAGKPTPRSATAKRTHATLQ